LEEGKRGETPPWAKPYRTGEHPEPGPRRWGPISLPAVAAAAATVASLLEVVRARQWGGGSTREFILEGAAAALAVAALVRIGRSGERIAGRFLAWGALALAFALALVTYSTAVR
jgi:hypothetical protein